MISLLQKNRAKKQLKKNYRFEPCIINESINRRTDGVRREVGYINTLHLRTVFVDSWNIPNVPKPSVEVGEGGVVRDVVDQEDASRLSKSENFVYSIQKENHFHATLRWHL